MSRVIAALLLVMASTAAARAQQGAIKGQRFFFLERSYFFFGTFAKEVLAAPDYYTDRDRERDDDKILFDAQPVPHIFLVNGLKTLDLRDGTHSAKSRMPAVFGDRWTLSFAFQARLRQLGGFSSPLRNPSFMPRFTVQRIAITRRNAGSFEPDNWIKVFGPTVVVWGHHSNGGAGCLFLEDLGEDCHSSIPPEQRTVNTQNGSFSTDYVRIGYNFLKGVPDANGNWLAKSWSFGGWVELNPTKWGPGSIPSGQRAIYGPTRFGLTLERQQQFMLFGKRWNAALNPTYQYISYDKKPSLGASPHQVIVDLSAVKEQGHFVGWGFAARYYQGQDFNNLLFIRDVRRIQVGLVIDQQPRSLP